MTSTHSCIEQFVINHEILINTLTGFATACGTVGTVIFGIVSSLNQNKNQFKFIFSDNARLFDSNTGKNLDKKYISLEIINIGNRTAKINCWGLMYKHSKWCFFIPPDDRFAVTGMKGYTDSFEPGHGIQLYYDYNTFCNVIKTYVDNKVIRINKKPKIMVADSLGNIYKVKCNNISKKYTDDISTKIDFNQ